MSLNKILKLNIIYSFLIKGGGVIINLALVPLGLNFLDKERFGIWLIINSILVWLTFFDLGLGNGLRNQLVIAISGKRRKEIQQLIATSYISLFVICLFLLLITLFFKEYIPWYKIFNVDRSWQSELSLVMTASIVLFLFQIFLKNITFIFHAVQMTALNSFILLISNLFSLIVIISIDFIGVGQTLLNYSLIICGTPIVVYALFTLWFFIKKYPFFLPSLFDFNKNLLGSLTSMGFKFFVIQVVAMVMYQGNNFFIVQYFGAEEVTIYNIAYKYFGVIMLGFSTFLTPFWSAFSKAFADSDYIWIRKVLDKVQKYWYGAFGVIILMIIFSNWIYAIWVGESIIIPIQMTLANAFFALIYCWNMPLLYLINGVGKISIQFWLAIFVIFLFPIITILTLEFFYFPFIVILINCFFQLLFSFFLYLQVNLIINKKAYGIWNN